MTTAQRAARSSRRAAGPSQRIARPATGATRRGAWLAIALLVLVPAAAFAHAVVVPAVSTPGAYERYLLRVPNEAGVATTRVEITFPADVRVISFADVPGWTIDVRSDTAGRITSAVWTGTLPPERFVEFPFMAVNPRAEARLVWPVVQTYADGIAVEWTGPEDSERPASATVIRATLDSAPGASRWPATLSVTALALAVVALLVSGRRSRARA